MIIRHYLKAHFVQNQIEKKFPIFDRNHGLTPLKISIFPLCQIDTFSRGRLVFFRLYDHSKHDFKAHVIQKLTERKFPIFDQTHGLIPLEK